MSAAVDRLIRIAEAEVGYIEKSWAAYKTNPNIIYSKRDGAGYDNVTKYGKEMHQIYPATMDFPAAWCDSFATWCFQQAFGTDKAKKILRGEFDDYTVVSAGYFERAGALDRDPRVGDQIFFSRNGVRSGVYHTGLVVGVGADTITTIEGNTSTADAVVANGGGVCKKTYSRGGKAIRTALFGHPAYDGMEEEVKPARTSAYGFEDGHRKGNTYRVTASSLNLRERPENGAIITQMPCGAEVVWYGYYAEIGGKRWLFVTYGDGKIQRSGYCAAWYLKKV